MKNILAIFLLALFCINVMAKGGSVHVKGYVRKDGTYVQPHMRSAPDGNFNNNWSTAGNINPYTGEEGKKVEPSNSTNLYYRSNQNTYETSSSKLESNGKHPDPVLLNQPKIDNPTNQATCNMRGKNCREVNIPPNAKLNYFGNDWECKSGYRKYGNECQKVNIPENGKLNYFGNDWECKSGYRKYGSECQTVHIPENGKLNYFGNDWECKSGYRKYGSECQTVHIPENGKLNYFGNDWECKSGYRKYGSECQTVQIPENAKLNYFGNDWECNDGYFKNMNNCMEIKNAR